jgi:hypothetical protein
MSACSVSPTSTDVFDANGTRLGSAGFERLMDDFVAEGVYQRTDGRISGENARELLTYALQAELVSQFLESVGAPLTQAQIDAATDDQIASAPEAMRALLARLTAADASLASLAAPARSRLEEMYASDPVTVGSVCARHILVDSESEARTVLRELSDGADFADVAARRSVDTGTVAVGGALEGATGPCIDISTLYDQQFDPDFLDAAFDAAPGVPTGPVKSAFGWHVIELRPWSEVADSVVANVAAAPGRTLFLGMVIGSDIDVRPDLGRWSRAAFAVVAS